VLDVVERGRLETNWKNFRRKNGTEEALDPLQIGAFGEFDTATLGTPVSQKTEKRGKIHRPPSSDRFVAGDRPINLLCLENRHVIPLADCTSTLQKLHVFLKRKHVVFRTIDAQFEMRIRITPLRLHE
jgi:hypothetical protein